jgi:hypothetical protein
MSCPCSSFHNWRSKLVMVSPGEFSDSRATQDALNLAEKMLVTFVGDGK